MVADEQDRGEAVPGGSIRGAGESGKEGPGGDRRARAAQYRGGGSTVF
jgi:hypothetical protein